MLKKLSILLVAAAAATGVYAQETLYLIKGDHLVGKYNVEDVDYATFELPADIDQSTIWMTVDNIGKNTVTYTVNTSSNDVAYAHNILSSYDIDFYTLNYYDQSFDELEEGTQELILKNYLTYAAYAGKGTQTYTQTDYEDDHTGNASYVSRFSVRPNVKYYLCVWEIDPVTQEPLDNFKYTTFTTLPYDMSTLDLSVSVKGIEYVADDEAHISFDITGDPDIRYVMTMFGDAEVLPAYIEYFGFDYTLYTFGATYSLDELKDDSAWPAYESGEYVLYVVGFDANGDMVMARPAFAEVSFDTEKSGPKISIFSKSATAGAVNVNFEIAPSNVEEAYVRLLPENTVRDRLNMGYTLAELAMGGDAIDITNSINTMGEYTYTNNELEEQWYSLLIYAKDKSGNSTVAHLNFYPAEGMGWEINLDAAHAPKKLEAPKRISFKGSPVIKKK